MSNNNRVAGALLKLVDAKSMYHQMTESIGEAALTAARVAVDVSRERLDKLDQTIHDELDKLEAQITEMKTAIETVQNELTKWQGSFLPAIKQAIESCPTPQITVEVPPPRKTSKTITYDAYSRPVSIEETTTPEEE